MIHLKLVLGNPEGSYRSICHRDESFKRRYYVTLVQFRKSKLFDNIGQDLGQLQNELQNAEGTSLRSVKDES